MTKHTPTPWVHGGTLEPEKVYNQYGLLLATNVSKYVTADEKEANAKFIVKAVNCHDELVEAMEILLSRYKEAVKACAEASNFLDAVPHAQEMLDEIVTSEYAQDDLEKSIAILTKAKGEA